MTSFWREQLTKHKQYLLSGVSSPVPFLACGGILIAMAIAFAPMTETGPNFEKSQILQTISKIGETAFALMFPVLAGYIAYAIASRPALVPGFIGGFIASQQVSDDCKAKAGFLGAILAGLLAGHIVNLIKKIPVPAMIRPVMPILVIPILSAVPVGVVMYQLNGPISEIMVGLGDWLADFDKSHVVILASILGAMIAFDMGGPINKAAFFFGAGLIEQGDVSIMGGVAVAICTPPLGLGLATLVVRKFWSEEERNAGRAALGMGFMGITEGAIPFAAADPFRIIPCLVAGSMVGAVIGMLAHVGDHAPHGGPIVLFAVTNKLMYIVAIVFGTLTTALLVTLVKARDWRRKQGGKPENAA